MTNLLDTLECPDGRACIELDDIPHYFYIPDVRINDSDINEVAFTAHHAYAEFFQNLVYRAIEPQGRNRELKRFAFLFRAYRFENCWMKQLDEYTDKIVVHIAFEHYGLLKTPLKDQVMTTKQEIFVKVHRWKLRPDRRDAIQEAVIWAKDDDQLLKEINAELDLFLTDYDTFFDKKLNGEIKYL
jgi:hypothetical protein